MYRRYTLYHKIRHNLKVYEGLNLITVNMHLKSYWTLNVRYILLAILGCSI